MHEPSRRMLITGASGDLGKAIARALAEQGWQLLLHAHRNRQQADTLAASIEAHGGMARCLQCDLADAEETRTALATALEQGPILGLVHAAGIHHDAPMAGMAEAQWLQVIEVSLHGFFRVCQPLLLPMARAHFGRIVALSSVAAVLGNRGQSNYAAAKAGLHGAVKSLAREMASRGISANVVAPGVVTSRMSEAAFSPQQIKALVPAARAGTPEEVAALVAFLCSDLAGYINGQVIGINGGMA